MSEGGDLEMFSAPAAQEHDEKSDEKFREEMRRAQKVLAQFKKDESKTKTHDDNLAAIIVGFMNDGHTDLFLLISRCVARDVSSELILAIISLIDKKASEKIKDLLALDGGKGETQNALTVLDNSDFSSLNAEQKKAIDDWIEAINKISEKKPHRTLESIIVTTSSKREISDVVVQLSAFVLRNYCTDQNINFEFDVLKEFMQAVFVKLSANLEKAIKEQKHIS